VIVHPCLFCKEWIHEDEMIDHIKARHLEAA
jgi:hypothetical protein